MPKKSCILPITRITQNKMCRINAGWIKIDRIKSIKKTGIYVKSISVSDMYACFVICNKKLKV